MERAKVVQTRNPRKPPAAYVKVGGALRWAKVSGRDYGRVCRIRWCTLKNGLIGGCHSKAAGGDGRFVYLHAFILGRREGYHIDHLDGDVRNCTRDNLRHVTAAVNAFNKPGVTRSRSGIRGVHRCGNAWRLGFSIRHSRLHLGVYKTLEEARAAADAAIGLIYGRGTRLTDNRPLDETHLVRIVSRAAGITPANMGRLLAKTLNLGDDLSAELRRSLLAAWGAGEWGVGSRE